MCSWELDMTSFYLVFEFRVFWGVAWWVLVQVRNWPLPRGFPEHDREWPMWSWALHLVSFGLVFESRVFWGVAWWVLIHVKYWPLLRGIRNMTGSGPCGPGHFICSSFSIPSNWRCRMMGFDSCKKLANSRVSGTYPDVTNVVRGTWYDFHWSSFWISSHLRCRMMGFVWFIMLLGSRAI